MDHQTIQVGLGAIVVTLLGGLIQRLLFAPGKVKLWVAYAGCVLASGLGWYVANHDAVDQLRADWRNALLGVYLLFLAARGAAGTSKDAKITPPTNSL